MVEETVGRKKLMKKLKAEQKKNADVRARKSAKVGSGTLTERAKKASAKAPEKRGLPARVDQPRGNVNRANPPKEIRLKGEGGTGRAVKDVRFKPIPLGDKPKALPAPAKANVRTFNPGAAAGRLLGPAGFLVGMTTPAGSPEESSTIRRDRSYGPLMRGNASRAQTVDRSEKGDRAVASEVKVDRAAPKPKARPAGGTTEAKRAAEFRKKAQGQKKVEAPKFKAPKVERPKFRGNWTGAAPTQMQSLAAQKPKRKSFSDLFKSK